MLFNWREYPSVNNYMHKPRLVVWTTTMAGQPGEDEEIACVLNLYSVLLGAVAALCTVHIPFLSQQLMNAVSELSACLRWPDLPCCQSLMHVVTY